MSEQFEPERYELREPPAYLFAPTRREFLELLGAGLLITVAGDAQSDGSSTVGARLHLTEDGTITVLTGKVEFGQGARTEVAMAAAEELRVPVAKIRVIMADTDLTPNDGITAGSRTTPATVPAVRKAAAALRQALANRTEGARLDLKSLSLPADVQVTSVRDWQVMGRSHPALSAESMVRGAHEYPSDIQRPGMLYGAVLRPPAYGATLASVNLDAAARMDGVKVVRDGNFAGCAAPTSYAARQAIGAMKAEWERKEHVSSARLFEHLKATAKTPREQSRGSVADALSRSERKLRATFQVPFIQHAPMEPRAAVAEWSEGKVTVWTGTQNPNGVRDQLAKAFGIGAGQVRVIVPDTGGGFGGKHTGEVAIEAARLAREAGRPVKLRWTRAEEFMWAYFRPAGLFEIEAGLDSGGLIQAWDFSNYNAGMAAIESPYKVADSRTRFYPCDSPLREGSYRGIAATANNFARECFIDELAQLAKRDPLEFRLANLGSERLRDVLNAAARSFRWEARRGETGIGIACGTEKGSYVAACTAVDLAKGTAQPRVKEMHVAFECGAIINPLNLRAQVEGAIVQGLGGALTEEIQFESGQLLNGSFAKYRVPGFRDIPPLTVVLVNRPDLPPVGAGETPIIAVAPSIANAVSQLTRHRCRSMPIRAVST